MGISKREPPNATCRGADGQFSDDPIHIFLRENHQTQVGGFGSVLHVSSSQVYYQCCKETLVGQNSECAASGKKCIPQLYAVKYGPQQGESKDVDALTELSEEVDDE